MGWGRYRSGPWRLFRHPVLVIAAMLALLVAGGVILATGPSHPKPGWHRVWADEFEGASLNAARWQVEHLSTFGEAHGELACLMNRPENVLVDAGLLTLRARREASPLPCGSNDVRFPQGREFSSAMVSTKGKAAWRYGRFEIRAKLPTQAGTSKGLWPAFWLRPVDGGAGELDVLEAIGGAVGDEESNRVHQTIWNDYENGDPQEGTSYDFPTGSPSDGFHTYKVVWRKGSIKWYIDGQRTFVRNRLTTPWLDEAFDRPFFLRLNLAVGGSWPGAPDMSTALPADYVIDYVRADQWR